MQKFAEMGSVMSHHESDYEGLLHQKGYRVTAQRLIVLDAVCEAGGHATFGEIFYRVKQADAAIDQSTVYRALDVWCEVGLVVSAEIGEKGKVYEIAGQSPHHHLVCQQCEAIQRLDNGVMQQLYNTIQYEYGFTVKADHLVISGICSQCQSDRSEDGHSNTGFS